ncbi:prepilin-type N-terminal cleavage/methylation domain-containing protein [Fictibacillus gelatini]|uniref:prepilin-type N-terminal cleavage/methylation domain-containing protein n=1 Tax=Fictibacillus gelatini TaxID=225985 RepID=UPI0004214E0C|nr:prepilin-type N-terminal cleavage/methylation domain-containing protein [Fictibacillus gelatini]
MKRISTNSSSEKGLTLVEILVSIVILSIIIVSMIPMFIQSAKSNAISKNIMDSTYLAQKEMEEIINMNNNSVSPSITDLSNQILKKGYSNDASCSNCYGINKNGHYVFIQIKNQSSDLGKVILKIYRDDKKNRQEAQMEMLLSWQK